MLKNIDMTVTVSIFKKIKVCNMYIPQHVRADEVLN